MTGKERVGQALAHREPDRVPIDFWSTRETDARLLAYLGLGNREDLLAEFGVDLRFIAGPAYLGPPLPEEPDGTSYDLWGVPRRQKTVTGHGWQQSYWEVTDYPLAGCETVADVAAYDKWPSPDWYDYSVIASQCAACGDACVVFQGDRLNRLAQLKPAMYLRGVEQILVDLLLAPEIFGAIVRRVCDFYLEYERRILAAANGGLDLLMTGDDFGTQDGLLISVEKWRQALRPGFAALIAVAHEYDVPVMHHTCGAVSELLPEFIACGLDVLQGVQPGARGMAAAELKREFGGDLAFHGGIGIQHALPHGTPEQVRDEVQQLLATMKPGGGYIAGTSHNLQADVPVANIMALIAAYHEFGGY